MPYAERTEMYKEIERIRKRPLIVYVTSTRQGGNGGQMGSDVIPEFCELINTIPKSEKKSRSVGRELRRRPDSALEDHRSAQRKIS